MQGDDHDRLKTWLRGRWSERLVHFAPAIGSTVDVANASWTSTIGDPELIAMWRDPAFDPTLSAFYYARDRDPYAAMDRSRCQVLRR